MWGSVWASARMSRAAGRDRREPRVAGGLRHLPGVGPGQVARPGLGGVAQVGGPLAREVDHEGAVGVVDLARPAAAGAVRQGALDAALEALRRARAHAVGREPHPLGDGGQRLAGVAQQQDPGPGGGLGLSHAHAGQPLEPLPVPLPQRHRRLRPCQTVPPVFALRQR